MLRPGEIVLEDAWRSFSARADRGRTLKELITRLARRDVQELPPTQALAGVSLRVEPGQTVGIVGRNGAGKTSTLRVLGGIIPLTRGRVASGGRIATLIELGSGFGREFTGRQNIHVAAALHGMSRAEVEARVQEIIDFSELGHFIDSPIKTYSSGMLVRLGFAVVAHLESDILLVDEVLAVGDEAFQRKCLRHIRARIATGTTVVLVSHAPATIEGICERVVVLDHGRVAFDGPTREGLLFYHRSLGMEDAEQEAARLARDAAVALRRAELHDGAGRPRQVFAPQEPLTLMLELESRAGAPDVQVMIDVRSASGTSLFRAWEPVPTSAGGGELRYEVERLALLGGDYEIAVSIHEPRDTAPGIDRLLAFSVTHSERGEGFLDPGGAWRFSPLPAEARR